MLDKPIELPPGVYTVQIGFKANETTVVIDLTKNQRVEACGYIFTRKPDTIEGIDEE